MISLQNIKRFLREHRLVLAVTLLIAVVAFTGWRRLMVVDTDPRAPAHPLGDADYTLRDFTLSLFNERGELDMTLSAQTMRHHPDQMRSEYVQPRAVLFQGGEARWTGRADTGWAGDDRREIALMDQVVLERLTSLATEALILRTNRLRLYPQDERATSEAAVRIDQPGAQVQGTGMVFDLKRQRYRLQADVQGRYAITDPD